MTPPPRAQRADAQANRQLLLEVARDAFVRRGDVSMTALAKLAGVGVGTLYRHFPTREALVLAVYEREMHALADLAPALLDTEAPVTATRLWFEALARYGRMKYGAAELIHAATSEGVERQAWDLVVGAIRTLLDAGTAAGDFRRGIVPDDVLWIVTFLWRIPGGDDFDERSGRMLDIVLDGLRAH